VLLEDENNGVDRDLLVLVEVVPPVLKLVRELDFP
jgi:hypothetical protein